MKKKTYKNLFWGVLLVIIILIGSHYDYEYQIEDKQADEDIRAANDERFNSEYHY